MKRFTTCLLILMMLLPLSAFAESENQNILIVYLSKYGNIEPSSDVDAIASASIQPLDDGYAGNTEILARIIAGIVGGDVFALAVDIPYPANYREHTEVAQVEKQEAARPALATHIENMDSYDIVFLGFPNWWSEMPMPVYTFLETYDLAGKSIIPFYTSGGSSVPGATDAIQAMHPEAVVLDAFTVAGADVLSSDAAIAAWIDSLGLFNMAGEAGNTETGTKVSFAFGGKKITAMLADNATSRDFIAMLPVTLTFSDYNSTEKVASLENALSTAGAPSGSDPDVGHLTYYAPWGNLAVFYRDFQYSAGLIPMGAIETGIENLAEMEGPVTISLVDGQ